MPLKGIIGQDSAVRALSSMIAKEDINGAYIFTGPGGVGKFSAGIEFAKAINCEKKEDACEECVSCRKINSLNHPDLFIIRKEEGSSFIKIDRIRDIIYQASLKPYEARKKIFIIAEAEDMNEESQNALLKILEEPRENQIFILTTSVVSGILATVFSRCKIVKFNLLSRDKVQEILTSRQGFNEEEAVLFSRMAMGSPGRAIAFKENDYIRERDRMLNDFFLKKRAIFREEVCDDKKYNDLDASLGMLLSWYRDLLVSKFTQDRNIFLNLDRIEEIFSYSARFSAEKIERDIASVMKTINYIRRNINPKMALFNMALELERQ
ncbi:MAG: DNA polymerase III subunit delta' [Candidatus Omnitrophica bacterium CG_4_9_14_0_2_um_filter_42_8]|nr:MAG: DNA polymerase III subunit delta' [Candidatus Omnitrophica bacterium CG_4_9_14_0_2_um_filter_42_8]